MTFLTGGDPKLKNFLGEHTPRPHSPPPTPRVWSAFVALFLLPARTPSKSHLKRSNVELPFFFFLNTLQISPKTKAHQGPVSSKQIFLIMTHLFNLKVKF